MENKKRLREMTNLEICKENNINGILLTNIVDESISKNKIRATLQIIAKALSSTLGPDGSTTILQDTERQHLVTKDGLDVISRMAFQDEIAKTVLDLVKNISREQVLAVGDGSTSAIIVANALYQEFTAEKNKEYFKYTSPKVIVSILNVLSEYLEAKLKKSAIPLSPDLHELIKIASIAMNNDEEVGHLIHEIYLKIGKYGFITTDVSEKYETDVVDYKKGISWKRGYIDPTFGEKYEGNRIIHEKPMIFITNSNITADDCDVIYRPLIGQICGHDKRELIIVANYITDEAKNFFKNVREIYKIGKPELFFTVVDIDQVTEISINNLKDLALLCGCEIYNKSLYQISELTGRLDPAYTHEDKYKFIGRALKGTITKSSTEIVCDDALLDSEGLKRKNEFVEKITKDLDELNKKSSLTVEETNLMYMYKVRKSNLENLTAILHVGGKTYEERRSRERLLEDAVFASKSAINNGYIVGGNIMIPRILSNDHLEISMMLKDKFSYLNQDESFFEYFVDLLKDSFLESYRSVLDNSYILTDEQIEEILNTILTEKKFYNLKTHEYEDFGSTNVINSVDTDVQIMRSCISLMGLLATSNQIVTINYNITDQVVR